MPKHKSKMQGLFNKSDVARGKPPKRPSKPITGGGNPLVINGEPFPNVYRKVNYQSIVNDMNGR